MGVRVFNRLVGFLARERLIVEKVQEIHEKRATRTPVYAGASKNTGFRLNLGY